MQTHQQQTIADIDELIGKLQATRSTLATIFEAGAVVHVPFTPTTTKTVSLGADSADKAPRKAPRSAVAPVNTTKPARPLRRSKEAGIGAAVHAVLPQFGDAWFSVDAVKEAVREMFPGKFDEDKIADVPVRLIGGVNKWLESQGAGRDRRYRNLPGKAASAESYEERKERLLK